MLILKELILYIILSIFLFKIFYRYISRFIIDKPVYRSSHTSDIPTSAGLIFLILHIVYVVINRDYILLIFVPIGLIGFLDDVFNIKQIFRLFFQSLNIFLISFLLINFDKFNIFQISNSIIFFIVFLAGITLVNCINFMDGIDGLVTSNMLLILLNYSLNNNLDLVAIPIVLFVFLFYNWSPAKMFMGDSGSTFLGILLFYITFSRSDFHSSLVILSTASPLLLDSLICIFRRLQNKENIFSAHKKHLYQRLHQKGMKHEQVTIIYSASTLVLITFSYSNNLLIMFFSIMIICAIGIFLEKNYALPFKN